MKKIDMTGWKTNEHGVPNSRWAVLREGCQELNMIEPMQYVL